MQTTEPNPGGQGTQSAAPAPAASGSALLDQIETKTGGGKGNIAISPELLGKPLGEAPIGQGTTAQEEDPFKTHIKKEKERKEQEKMAGPGQGAPGAAGGAKPGGTAPLIQNPGLKDLSPDEKQEAAENLAKLAMFGYEKGFAWADKKLQVSERNMLKIRTEGKIDVDHISIPIDGGQLGFEEFVKTYNEQTRGTMLVEQDFKDDVLPVLTKVLAKYGAGVSDEQYLLGKVSAHLVMSGQKFYAQTQTMKAFLAYAQKLTSDQRGEGYQAPVVPMHSSPPPAAPPPPPENPVPPGAIVITPDDPRYAMFSDPGAEGKNVYALPQWGTKDNLKALKNASRKVQAATITPSSITAAAPNRRRVGGHKKNGGNKKAG